VLKQDKKKGKAYQKKKNITATQVKTKKLEVGHTYYWRIRGCNTVGCAKGSAWWKFKVSGKGILTDAGPATDLDE
jgi:hypothetical protein